MFKAIYLAVLLFIIFYSVALAQNDAPPAGDLISAVVGVVAALAALVSNAVINFIKSLPYLGDEDKDKLATGVTQIIAVVVSLITGYLSALVAQGLGLIDDTGVQGVVVASLTPVLAELRYRLAKLAPK